MSELSVEAPLLVGVDALLDVFLAFGHHEVDQAGVDLPRFGGHLISWEKGVQVRRVGAAVRRQVGSIGRG